MLPTSPENLPPSETQLTSFVLRFIYEEPPATPVAPVVAWRGVLRHVQSNTEIHFTRWEEAAAFIAQYVQL